MGIEGDNVRLSFTTLRDLNAAASVTMAGPSIGPLQNSVTPSPASLTAHGYAADYVMTAGDAEATVPFTISIVDAAGNAIAAPVTAITSGSNVTSDRTNPVFAASIHIASQLNERYGNRHILRHEWCLRLRRRKDYRYYKLDNQGKVPTASSTATVTAISQTIAEV